MGNAYNLLPKALNNTLISIAFGFQDLKIFFKVLNCTVVDCI
jgi:hypothetical protein